MEAEKILVTGAAQAVAQRCPTTPRLNRKEPLLGSKCTTRALRNREKHLIVSRVDQLEPPPTRIELVEIAAVVSRRSVALPWRDLTHCRRWLQGRRQAMSPAAKQADMIRPPRLAVVGAGIACLSCATPRRSAGFEVAICDKSHGPSGRMRIRRGDNSIHHKGAKALRR
jgi:hypothetical protein